MNTGTVLNENESRLVRISAEAVRSSYRRYARIYDSIFGFTLEAGRRQAVQYLDPRRGTQVLEIGVGTGLSLPLYPEGTSITGIDLSPEMLKQAQGRALKLKGRDVRLFTMDAGELSFADDSFDASVAMYVASVAPNPEAIVSEMKRVTRNGGHILIVNHFSQRGSLMCLLERAISPLAPLLGFQPLFYLHKFMAATDLVGARVMPVNPLGYWLILAIRNEK